MFSSIKSKIKNRKNKFQVLLDRNKKRAFTLFFLGGLIFDFLTLTRIDALYGNIVLSTYLLIALFSIFLTNLGDYKDIKNRFLFKLYQYSPFITQFSFGALFSGFIIFYTISGTFFTSWPFLIILYLIFIFNEKATKYYEKFDFQISIFFLTFFAFNILFIPLIFKKVGTDIFVISGLFSLIFIFIILKFIFKILPILKKKKLKIFFNFFIIFCIFNLAYFFHIIPPVPLSIKKIEIAHEAGKNNLGQYYIKKEIRGWSDFYDKWNNVHYIKNNGKVYIFVSVFAPTGLKTKITHSWEFFDENKKEWIIYSELKYNIIGGRDGGYRWYTYLSNAQKGKWRVNVKNESGFLMGRESFEIVDGSDKKIKLETKIMK